MHSLSFLPNPAETRGWAGGLASPVIQENGKPELNAWAEVLPLRQQDKVHTAQESACRCVARKMHMVTRQQIREGKLCEHLSSFVVKASIMRAIIRGRGDDCGAIFCSCCRIAFTFDEISINIHAWNMAAQVGAYFPNAALPCKNEFGYSVKINVHIGLRRI